MIREQFKYQVKPYRFVSHFFPELSRLASKICDREARELGLDALPALVHPDEVGGRVPLGLSGQLGLLDLPFTPNSGGTAVNDKQIQLQSKYWKHWNTR